LYPCIVEYYGLHLREDQKFQVSGKEVLRKPIGLKMISVI
jgi:hypothetical protein